MLARVVRPSPLLLLTPTALICMAHPALASERAPAARLLYDLGEGAESCPARGELTRAVEVRLGYDPFHDDAERSVVATIRRHDGDLVGRVELRDGTDRLVGARDIGAAHDCADLVASMALAISLAIDPLGSPHAVSPPTLAPAPALAPPPQVPGLERPPASGPPTLASAVAAPPGRVVELGAGAVIGIGTAPAPTVGVSIQAGVRWSTFSLSLEGRGDVPSSRSAGGGQVSASLLSASLLPCLHHSFLMGCAVASLGSIHGASAGVGYPASDDSVYGAIGARLGVVVPLWRFLLMRAYIDGSASLSRTTLTLNGTSVWTSPPVAGALGLAFAGGL